MLSAANNKIDTLVYTPSSKTRVFLSPVSLVVYQESFE
jgi:hypothetical protein